MKKFFKIAFLVSLLSVSLPVFSQYYTTGTEAFGTRWRVKSFGKINLIFPSDAEKISDYYLNSLIKYDSLVGQDYGITNRRIDVVLHNHTSASNGFVAWAPRRMELITQNPTNSYAQLWHEQLAVHESRHVKQMYALNKGFVKFNSIFIGQQAVGLAASFVPSWFLEGDAVYAETHYSKAGRGRDADFLQYYRAHFLSGKKNYSYDKWLLGSYKNYIPNYYPFGYMIVNYGNIKYGNKIWTKTIRHTANFPFIPFTFYFGLKHQTGLSRKHMALQAINYQDSIWKTTVNTTPEIPDSLQAVRKPKVYTNYQYPFKLNDSTIIAYRTSLDKTPAFVLINTSTRKTKKLCNTGLLQGSPAYSKQKTAWVEYKPHWRWDYLNGTELHLLNNTRIRKQTIINLHGRYYSPAFYNDSSIYLLGYTTNGNWTINLFCNETVKTIFTFDSFIEPLELAYNQTNNKLYILATTAKGKCIFSFDSNAKNLLKEFGPTTNNINSIFAFNNNIIFSASIDNAENLVVFNTNSGKLNYYNTLAFGSKYPSVQNDTITFSEYTPKGYIIVLANEKNLVKNNIETLDFPNDSLNDHFTQTENAKHYESKPYRELTHLFNFHSWMPFYVNVFDDLTQTSMTSTLRPGITLLSQNLTGTTISSIGYGYGNSNLFMAGIKYLGWWPVIYANYSLFDYNAAIYRVTNDIIYTNEKRWEAKVELALPVTLSNNSFYTFLQPFTNITLSNDYLYSSAAEGYRSGLTTVHSGVTFYSYQQLATRDIFPRLGVVSKFENEFAPTNRNNLGNLNALYVKTFLPGMFTNHSLQFTLKYQHQYLKNFYFSNRYSFPRGYSDFPSQTFYSLSADYCFPLIYPDLAIRSLIYLKRISVDLFYDYGKNSYPMVESDQLFTKSYTMNSFGYELFIDFHLFRTRFPFRLTYRYGFAGNNFSSFSVVNLNMDIYSGNRAINANNF